MTKVKRCSQCGKEVSQGGSFCPFCGNIINETVKSESRESAIDGLDNDIQKKYQNDINKKLQKQKQLEYQKENLLKKKNSLGLKIYNYSKIIQKEIPCCERNKTAPNMPVIKTENSKMDVKWYIAACIAVLEFISGFMPWVSLYYADLFQGQTISCAGIFDLLNDISKFQDWTNSTPEVLGVFVFIIMFGFVMLFINGYFIAQVLQKKESEVSGTIAGISGIVVSVAILLYKWNLDISMEEDNWKWISINTQVGVWLMLLAGIALICVIVFYKSDTEAETKNKPNLEFEVMNYDPVLPIRMKTLKIRKENGKLILELTYAEFEWASIEEFIVDIQLVRYDGTVNTFAQNALFEKKGQNFARFQLQDAGYDLDSIASARVNILGYNIYKSLKKYEEKGSGFSAYSDYSVDELRSATHDNHEVNEKYIAGNNEEKKHGMLILKSGEVVNTEYQKYMLSYTVPDIVKVYDGANYGMLGSNGELIVPCSYDSCEISEDGAYITADRQRDEYGNYTECTLFDSNGNKIETFDTGIYNVGVFRKISNAA